MRSIRELLKRFIGGPTDQEILDELADAAVEADPACTCAVDPTRCFACISTKDGAELQVFVCNGEICEETVRVPHTEHAVKDKFSNLGLGVTYKFKDFGLGLHHLLRMLRLLRDK